MKVKVGGAGAGKTTKMADAIFDYYKLLKNDAKKIFCITFTNTAKEIITNRVSEKFGGDIPSNILISTIHSFLNQEIIKPYNFLVFNKHYQNISHFPLGDKPQFRERNKKNLEEKNIIHVDLFTQKSKWITVKKTKDTELILKKREIINNKIIGQTSCVFIDEAQDIDNHFLEILLKWDQLGLDIRLYGDPKQDLSGKDVFRKLILEIEEGKIQNSYCTYDNECYRCPENILKFSNLYISELEKQTSLNDRVGTLNYIYETDYKTNFEEIYYKYKLVYIYNRGNNFITKPYEKSDVDKLSKELCMILYPNHIDDHRNRAQCYNYIKEIMRSSKTIGIKKAVSGCFPYGTLEKDKYMKILSIIPKTETGAMFVAKSIQKVKGDEASKCLFILDTALAPYLFFENIKDNSTKNKLYVALTRTKSLLTFFICESVEKRWGRESINSFFESHNIVNK